MGASDTFLRSERLIGFGGAPFTLASYAIEGKGSRNYIFVNKDAWEDLDESTRNIVKGLAMLAEKAGTTKSQQLTDWYMAQLAANGMTVQPAGDKLHGELEQIGATMTEEWLANAGDAGKSIVDSYKAN